MNNLKRRDFLKTAGAAAAALGGCAKAVLKPSPLGLAETGPGGASNVLILKSDEHSPFYGRLGRFNWVRTPNMRRLADRGVVFENAYCASPLCSPSRSAFCAGRRVHQLQTYSNCNIFKHDYPSYGGILAKAGVHTAHIGKTDFYNDCGRLGFTEVIAPLERPQPNPFICRKPLDINPYGAGHANDFGVSPDNLKADIARTDDAVAWIHEKATGLKQPWTCEVNLIRPHFPHFATQALWDEYADHEDLPNDTGEEESANHPYALDLRAHFQTASFTQEQVRGLRRGYYACTTFMDQQIGRILNALDETGLSSNTVTVYTSDHGEMLGKFGMWWKCSLYEDSVRVPLIVAGPGFPTGSVVRTPVDQLDLQATLFRATNRDGARPSDWVGNPLEDIPSNDQNRVVFSEYHGHGTRASSYMVRKGDWKLIYYAEAPHQLFNLREDPDELNNLAGSKPGKMSELQADLHAICDPELENQRAEAYIQKQLASLKAQGLRDRAPSQKPSAPAGEGGDVDLWRV